MGKSVSNQNNKWDFYGREEELENVQKILERQRWFFLKITGRRRIGKTTLVQKAIHRVKGKKAFYMQIPDADAAGVVMAANRYFEMFDLNIRVTSLAELAAEIMKLVRMGFVVSLDEFQYFNRKSLYSFCSFLQAEVDLMSQENNNECGGLIVLGSLQSEMNALLDDRLAPLYNRVTDEMQIGHLDFSSLKQMWISQGGVDVDRIIFMWNLFEGVPKFYRDAFEQGVLGVGRKEALEALFFRSSSPLKSEAENWFQHELKGRYDTLLQYLAKNPGSTYGELAGNGATGSEESKQLGGYLVHLEKKMGMIEKRQPIFGKNSARTSRYYITDHLLKSWIFALKHPVQAQNFMPKKELIHQADEALEVLEGYALEEMTAQLIEELSRKGVSGFELNYRVQGFWDRMNREIDLIAVMKKEVWFISCKRNPDKQLGCIDDLKSNAEYFTKTFSELAHLETKWVCVSPDFNKGNRKKIESTGAFALSIAELFNLL